MNDTAFLQGKRILAVDDEPDILETLEEILDMCQFDSADNFEDAKAMIQQNSYDAAILDIMGSTASSFSWRPTTGNCRRSYSPPTH